MLFLRPRVATLRLRKHANHVPSIPCASRYQSLPKNKPQKHLKNSMRGRCHGLTLNLRNKKMNMLSADIGNKKAN